MTDVHTEIQSLVFLPLPRIWRDHRELRALQEHFETVLSMVRQVSEEYALLQPLRKRDGDLNSAAGGYSLAVREFHMEVQLWDLSTACFDLELACQNVRSLFPTGRTLNLTQVTLAQFNVPAAERLAFLGLELCKVVHRDWAPNFAPWEVSAGYRATAKHIFDAPADHSLPPQGASWNSCLPHLFEP